jgi:cullin-associated NEDD8-dissociated protein 1
VTDASEFRVDAVLGGEPTAAAAAARLLVQASFGPTNASITAALAAIGRDPGAINPDLDTALAEAWVAAQLAEPATLLREHFRRRANTRAYYEPFSGPGTTPCDDGARFNRYSFDRLDVGRVIEVVSDPIAQTFDISDGAFRTRSSTFGSRSQGIEGASGWPGSCQCRNGSICALGRNRASEWCEVESALFCGDAERTVPSPNTNAAFSYNVCNLPTVPGTNHVQLGSQSCSESEGMFNFGTQSTVEMCAQRCREHAGCTHFIYGSGNVQGRCSKEYNGVNDTCGEGGFSADARYNFYKLDDNVDDGQLSTETRAGVLDPSEPVQFRICSVDERIGGTIGLVQATRSCTDGRWLFVLNPAIELSATAAVSIRTINNASAAVTATLVWDLGSVSLQGQCRSGTITTVNGSAFIGIRGTSFGQRARDVFHYRFDRRTRWADNTPASPADLDANSQSSGQADVCPAVPRTVLNEESCVRRVSSSCGVPTFSSAPITLDHGTLTSWYAVSNTHVYSVRGLRFEEGRASYAAPCTSNVTSRWTRVATSGGCSSIDGGGSATTHNLPWGFGAQMSLTITRGDTVRWTWDLDGDAHDVVSGTRTTGHDGSFRSPYQRSGSFSHTFNSRGVFQYYCSPHPGMDANITVINGNTGPVVLSGNTASTIAAAISSSTDTNPTMHDILVDDGACRVDASTIGAYVEVGTGCWHHSHPDEGNVYDFSQWALQHPGNVDLRAAQRRNPITAVGESGLSELAYPSWHEMARWESVIAGIRGRPSAVPYVGRLGDVVDFAALPPSVQTVQMAEAVGSDAEYPAIGFESCGSRGEIANDPTMANRFHMMTSQNSFAEGVDQPQEEDSEGKQMVWTTVVLNANDQLRQRTAFGLSQIFVTSAMNFDYGQETELWVHFYDTFVEHAFGNYRDIMREVSASPLMGRYLTLLGNAARSYSGSSPDENYARELMQLFSIGLYRLEMDGSRKTDPSTGAPLDTYTNEDIVSFSRVWTGWYEQSTRSNIANVDENRFSTASENNIDPMRLLADRRDKFPKALLGGAVAGGHIGDNFPLCSELPPRHFLLSGAKFRYSGDSSLHGANYDEIPTAREHFTPDSASSGLYSALCQRGDGSRCTFPPVVTLESDVACNGAAECGADMVHAIKIVDGDAVGFYTYVPPPCVRLQFFEGHRSRNGWAQVCANPDVASTNGAACCYDPQTQLAEGPACPAENPFYDSGGSTRGDLCRHENNNWVCPLGCQETTNRRAPYCVLQSNTSAMCQLGLGGIASSNGAECLFVAEPMKFSTAEERCAAEYTGGVLCSPRQVYDLGSSSQPDGSSPDWQATCGGYQYAWTNQPCSLQVQVYPSGEVSIVDHSTRDAYLEVHSSNKFTVAWGSAPAGAAEAFPATGAADAGDFPTYASNCSTGCLALSDSGGSCLCDIEVVNRPFITSATSGQVPTESDLRASLKIGASAPERFGADGTVGYTLCSSSWCTSRSGVRVYTKGTGSASPTMLDIDSIFEFTATPAVARPSTRRPARYLMNRVSAVHVGHTDEFRLLNPYAVGVASCSASSEADACSLAHNNNFGGWDGWVINDDLEGAVGAWIQLNFDTTTVIDTMAFQGWQWDTHIVRQVRLQFSDGSSQHLALDNTVDGTRYLLETPVTTSFVNITIEALHLVPCVFPFTRNGVTFTECAATPAWRADGENGWCATSVDAAGAADDWGHCSADGVNTVTGGRNDGGSGHGIREVAFYGPGAASIVSATPCEDAGLLPVSAADCEMAYAYVVPTGVTRLEGLDLVVDDGDRDYLPPGCSLNAGDPASSGDGYTGDFHAQWNPRVRTYVWQTRYWPVCSVPGTGSDRTGFQFRNPPHFVPNAGDGEYVPNGRDLNPYGDGNHYASAAEHETEALIDHVFEHDNTPPFVAVRMIQRLTTSNPSPRYVQVVATAFQEGVFDGVTYSGKYGCMAATIAAIILDREARTSLLDFDQGHGQLREPVLKVIHLMRSMEFSSKRGMEVQLHAMSRKIGQMVFEAPSVFSFFKPEFAPSGRIEDAGLVSPEAQLATAPLTIGYLNGITSLINFGLTSCGRGFGDPRLAPSWNCGGSTFDGVDENSAGGLSFVPTSPSNPDAVVAEIGLLLFAGRMSSETQRVLVDAYTSFVNEEPFDIAARVARVSTSSVSEAECLASVKAEVRTTSIAATCTASSENPWRYPRLACDSALAIDSRDAEWANWLTDSSEEPIGSWIRLQFDAATSVDKMVVANICNDEIAPIANVLLAFSDGSSQQVTLPNNCDGATVPLLTAVTTSFVTMTIQSRHPIDGTGDSTAGLRMIRFYSPSSVVDPYATQVYTWLTNGTFSNAPPGCSYRNSDWESNNAAYFNYDPVGCAGPSCGWYTSIVQDRDTQLWATQSSQTSANQNAWQVVDGDASTCTWTDDEASPWWQLDLGSIEQVTSVVLQNRLDWVYDYNVDIYLDGTRCAQAIEFQRGQSLRIPCIGTGRLIRVVIPDDGDSDEKILSFCDLTVNVLQTPSTDGSYVPNSANEEVALKRTLKLAALAPEFHATAVATPPLNGPKEREPFVPQESLGRDYKAVVVVYLAGGADSWNMVVPHSGCKDGHDLFSEYETIRGRRDTADRSALTQDSLLQFDVDVLNATHPHPCDKFGLHPSLTHLRDLYNDGDMAVLANTGPLVEPITYDDYTSNGRGDKRYPPGMFGHNTQSQEVWTVKAGYRARDAKGVLGRIANTLRDQPDPYKTALYTMDGYAPMLDAGLISPEVIDPGEGVVRFSEFSELADGITALHNHESQSLFSDTFSTVLQSSLASTEVFGLTLENVTLDSGRVFPDNRLGPQLEEVSKVLHLHKTEVSRTERAAFYTSIGGFDTHDTMDISELMSRLNDGLAAFTDELKDQGLWQNVTVVVASEFGRTLSSNSQGSDHGWGGNYFVLGGDVKGRQMLGKYPSRLTEFVSEANIGRGRMIPSTPWESVWNGVGEWIGLDAEDRLELLPNMANFPVDAMFSHSQLFKSSAPTAPPSMPPTTLPPTTLPPTIPSAWDLERVQEMTVPGDANACYYVLWAEEACASAGGVYRISPSWYTQHYGGPFGDKTGPGRGCGSVKTFWGSINPGHQGYISGLMEDDDIMGPLGIAAHRVADYDCAPPTNPPSTTSPTFPLTNPTNPPTTTSPTFPLTNPTNPPSTTSPTFPLTNPTNPPTTSAPVTTAPVTAVPTTRDPSSSNPTTSAPVTSAPVTAAPTTRDPSSSNPTTSAPVTASPVTSSPVTAPPSTLAPTIGPDCEDRHHLCVRWADIGYCLAVHGHDDYMNANCQASCHRCPGSEHSTPPRNTRGTLPTTTASPITPPPTTPPPTTPPPEPCHFSECGRSGRCRSETGSCDAHSTRHEVRCCSSVAILGWTNRGGACAAVWGESDDTSEDWSCTSGATFDEAAAICEGVGARLCTVRELQNDCTRGTGCGHDNDLIWSSNVGTLPAGQAPQLAESVDTNNNNQDTTSTEGPITTTAINDSSDGTDLASSSSGNGDDSEVSSSVIVVLVLGLLILGAVLAFVVVSLRQRKRDAASTALAQSAPKIQNPVYTQRTTDCTISESGRSASYGDSLDKAV